MLKAQSPKLSLLIFFSVILFPVYFNTPGIALAQEKIKLAIIDLKAKNVSKETVDILNEIMVVEVQGFKHLSIISKKEIGTMLKFEEQKQIVGCEDDISCLSEIVGAYGVEMLISGSVGKIGATYVVNLQLINIKAASVENRVSRTVKGEEDKLIGSIKEAVGELISVIKVKEKMPPPPRMGDMEVRVDLAGAKVYLDGKIKGEISEKGMPLKIKDVSEGRHIVKVIHDDYEEKEREVEIIPGDMVRVEMGDLRFNPGKLLVRSTPSKADVFLDGRKKGETPCAVELPPGKYKVRVDLEGYESGESEIEIKPNKKEVLNLGLKDITRYGYLNVTSTPEGASIYIDGDSKGETPKKIKVPSGSYTLKASKRGYKAVKERVSVTAEDTKEISLHLTHLKRSRWKAGLFSLVLPGGGKFYHGKNWWGTISLITTAGSFGTSYLLKKESDSYFEEYEGYKDGIHLDEINDSYKKANDYHNGHQLMLYVGIGIWALDVISSLIIGPAKSPESSSETMDNREATWRVEYQPEGMFVLYERRF